LHTLGTLVFGLAAQIAAGVATARAFGPAGKGVLSLATIFVLFGLTAADGLKSAAGFEIRRRPLAVVHGSAVALALGVGLAGAALFGALAVAFPGQLAYRYVAVAFPFAVYLHTVSVFYQFAGRLARVNVQIMATVGGGGALAMLLAVGVFRVSLPVALAIWSASFVIGALVNGLGARGFLPAPRFELAIAREHLVFALRSTAANVATLLAQRIDVLVVGRLLSASDLGIYALAVASGEMLWQLSRSITWSTNGAVATAEHADALALTQSAARLVLALQLGGGVALAIVAPRLIAAVYGAAFAPAGAVLRVLLPGVVLYSADALVATFITVRLGRPGVVLAIESANAAICGALALVLVPRVGMIGGAIATTVAYGVAVAAKVLAARALGAPTLDIVPRPADARRALDVVVARLRRSSSTRDSKKSASPQIS